MLFLLLLLIWIILNGKITVEILVIGCIVSFFVTLFSKKCLFSEYTSRKLSFKRVFLLLEYYVVLVIEIVKANIATLKVLLKKEIEIKPCLCRFKTKLKDPDLRILLANSITLTPGTITVELDNSGNYVVHCLTKEFADGMDDSVFVKMLMKMEEN